MCDKPSCPVPATILLSACGDCEYAGVNLPRDGDDEAMAVASITVMMVSTAGLVGTSSHTT